MNRRDFLKKLGKITLGGTLMVGSGGCGAYQYGRRVETEWLEIESVSIPIKQLPADLEGFKIVHMSDFHLYPFTHLEFIKEAVTMTNSLTPDLITLTGDYVLRTAEAIFDLAPALAALDAKYGIFMTIGNHDIWTDIGVVTQGLKESRLPVLINEGLALDVGSASIYVAGLDDQWSGRPDLAAAMDGLPTEAVPILLMHEPDFADIAAQDGRIALQLSGHSHGGQVRLPALGAPILPPYGRKYNHGLYKVKDMWVYTNRGIGVIGPPVRINCRPEITEITLTTT